MNTEQWLWELATKVRAELIDIVAPVDWTAVLGRFERKGSIGDIVTYLDRDIEIRLAARLRRLLASSTVAGEEHGGDIGSPTWIVDPIDGSTNIVHGLRHAASTVALSVNGAILMGVVYDIFQHDAYMAVGGAGALRVSQDNGRHHVQVSSVNSLNRSLVGFGLPYDRSRSSIMFRAAEGLFLSCQDLRRSGSSALDLIAVANGQLEAHVELDLRAWDVAAAALVLAEAGGHVTTWNGDSVDWYAADQKSAVVASNGLVHGELLELLLNQWRDSQ
jgi:myo-inositol-1(or 4)-monophosphatase